MIRGLLLLLVTGLTAGAFIRSDQLLVNQPRVPNRPRAYQALYFLPRLNLYDVGISPFHFQQEQIRPSPFFTEDPEEFKIEEERVGRAAEREDSESEQPNSEYYKEWILQNLG